MASQTVNVRWNNLTAILAGDFLLAKASEIAASLGTEVAGLLARTIGRLCEGEILELRHAYSTARTEEAYFAAIEGKTASLYATACRIGAIVAGLPRDQVDALTDYGLSFGMAFQLVDDVLDLVATEEELGKPAAHDLTEGIYNLPVLRALDTDAGEALRGVLGSPIEGAERERARALVLHSGGIESTMAEAERHAQRAQGALAYSIRTLVFTPSHSDAARRPKVFPASHRQKEGQMSLNRFVAATAAVLLLTFLPGRTALAQAVYGSIAGTVTDSTGAALPGVTVTVTSVERKTTDTGQRIRLLREGPPAARHLRGQGGAERLQVGGRLRGPGQRRHPDQGRLQAGGRPAHRGGDRQRRRGPAPQDRPRGRGHHLRRRGRSPTCPSSTATSRSSSCSRPAPSSSRWNHAASENPQGSAQTR